MLAPGALVMHSVPFCFPMHEAPADYWRFTHHGLAQLFGPANGYAVLDSGMVCETRLVPEWRGIMPEMPLIPGFAEAWIYARKVAEPPEEATAASAYPLHAAPVAAMARWTHKEESSFSEEKEAKRLLSMAPGIVTTNAKG